MADRRPSLRDRLLARVRSLRDHSTGFDHAVRAYDRNTEVYGTQLAAAITYFAFLSFFPLLALAFSILGYVVEFAPGADTQLAATLEDAFPGLVGTAPGQIDVQGIADARVGAGVVGLLGLLYTGLGWVGATREALRRAFGLSRDTTGFVKRKVADVAVLVLLGLSIALTVAVSTVATSATTALLGLVGLEDSVVALVALRVLAIVVALALDMAIFAVLLSRLGGTDTVGKRPPWPRIRSGALLGAVGFELLKLLATYLIGNTLGNPVYGAFAIVVGLLVWINFVSRLLVFTAAWTTTEGYSLTPFDGYGGGAGRTTPLAVGTEPVFAVAPPGPPAPGGATAPPLPAVHPAPAGRTTAGSAHDRRRRTSGAGRPGRRAFGAGAALGGAAGVALARRWRSRSMER